MFGVVLGLSLVGLSLQAGLPGTFVPIQSAQIDAQPSYVKPAFCHDLECPKYTVVETNAVSDFFRVVGMGDKD